jgi:hypothetical protein
MEDFNTYLESWRTFHAVVAGSSATLMGLIFLSVSLHLDLFRRGAEGEPRQIAWQTFINFFWVFTIGIVFLLPNLTDLALGLIILMLGLAGGYITSRRWCQASKHLSLRRGLVAFVPLVVCYLGMVLSGLLSMLWSYNALIILAPVIVFLIGVSIRDAWRLLINAGDYPRGQ